MKKREILARIEAKEENYYRNIAKDYLENYPQFDDFEKAVLSEVICVLINRSYSVQECLFKISTEYNINCKKIVFWAIVPLIKMETIKSKLLFFTHINDVIFQCLSLMKNQVVKEAFKCS